MSQENDKKILPRVEFPNRGRRSSITPSKRIGIASGYFNPLHLGHIQYLNAAKAKCDCLIVIINNDKQVLAKGSTPYLNERDRQQIVSNLKAVDFAVISIDTDLHIGKSLITTANIIEEVFDSKNIRCFTFFNSGDRDNKTYPEEEVLACEAKSIKMEFLDLPKINSSSQIKAQMF